jgi:hypothetical protein
MQTPTSPAARKKQAVVDGESEGLVAGIEDARALTVLWRAGVDSVQDNFLQRPAPTLRVQP